MGGVPRSDDLLDAILAAAKDASLSARFGYDDKALYAIVKIDSVEGAPFDEEKIWWRSISAKGRRPQRRTSVRLQPERPGSGFIRLEHPLRERTHEAGSRRRLDGVDVGPVAAIGNEGTGEGRVGTGSRPVAGDHGPPLRSFESTMTNVARLPTCRELDAGELDAKDSRKMGFRATGSRIPRRKFTRKVSRGTSTRLRTPSEVTRYWFSIRIPPASSSERDRVR